MGSDDRRGAFGRRLCHRRLRQMASRQRARGACPTTRASTNGTASRAPPTRPSGRPSRQAKAAGVDSSTSWRAARARRAASLQVYDLEQRRLIDAEITRRTIDFMKRSADAGKPFYAYVPFTLVHFPTLPNPNFAGRTGHGDFPDALAEMDAHVGEILDAIDELGHSRQHHRGVHQRQRPGGNLALAGLVGTVARLLLHAYGRLVADAVHHPLAGPVPAGRVSNEIVHEVDTFTTFAAIAGAGAAGPRHRRRRPDRFPARQSEKSQSRRLPGVRGRPSGSGEMAELEDRLLRRAAGLVDAARQSSAPRRRSTSSPIRRRNTRRRCSGTHGTPARP